MITIGTTVSHYRIRSELGKGGMGVVYCAEDLRLGRLVALKFLSAEELRPDVLERFQREARSASALNHPNICTIYNVEETVEGFPFIVMEYLEGVTLRERICERRIETDELLHFATQIAAGLEAAHHKGIVHRDIKPGNIFLMRNGRLKILDFGLARRIFLPVDGDSIMSTMGGEQHLTGYGTAAGTAAYMSPEQARGEDLDQRTDLFSFGAVVYEMATGRNPFASETPALLFDSILNRSPVAASLINPAVPHQMDVIIGKALEKEAARRYQSAAEILTALDRLKSNLSSRQADEPSSRPRSIAVLPFADMSPEGDQEYFCDGIAEELISALTKVAGLRVAARTSAFRFRGRAGDIRGIGEQLQVDTLLEGSVRKSGSKLRITVQLVNVKDGFELWSERYDREIRDVLAIQDEIAAGVVNKLKAQLGSGSLMQRHSVDIEAYNLFLKGRYQWNKRTAESLTKSIEFFQQAISRDPAYVLAYVGLADSYGVLGYQESASPIEVMPLAKAAAQKALEMDDSVAEAHASLAYAHMHYDRNWKAAEAGYQQALRLNPFYATGHHWYALQLAAMSRFEESIAVMKHALELDPLSLIINAVLGYVYYFARRYDDAIGQGLRTLEIDSGFSVAHMVLGLAYEQKGMREETFAAFESAVANSQSFHMALACLGHACGVFGRHSEAHEVANRLRQQAGSRHVSSFYLGLIHAGLGEKDQAFSLLDQAVEQHASSLMYLRVDPQMDSLRADDRFQKLLSRVGLESPRT